jgi:hypothetical protein
MKTFDTPYGLKTAGLLMLSMDAYNREDKANAIIKALTEKLRQYAPKDSTHEGLENCELIANANAWLEKRQNQIAETEERANQEYN